MKSLLDFINEFIRKDNVKIINSDDFITYTINDNGDYDIIICDDESFIISSNIDVYGSISVSYASNNFIHILKKIDFAKFPAMTELPVGMCYIPKLRNVVVNLINSNIILSR